MRKPGPSTRFVSLIRRHSIGRPICVFFRVRAVIGVEQVTDATYTRTIRVGQTVGMLTISNDASKQMLEVTLRSDTGSDTHAVVHHLQRSLDLEADIGEITAHLSRHADLVPPIALRPAICVPVHWDPFETAMRSVLGQQVTLAAAARLNARLVQRADGLFAASERAFLTCPFLMRRKC
jgi:AraC family transcriptional regulator, regulatory protein of adaptative response / DNA-3-methyladenine glycosylase II